MCVATLPRRPASPRTNRLRSRKLRIRGDGAGCLSQGRGEGRRRRGKRSDCHDAAPVDDQAPLPRGPATVTGIARQAEVLGPAAAILPPAEASPGCACAAREVAALATPVLPIFDGGNAGEPPLPLHAGRPTRSTWSCSRSFQPFDLNKMLDRAPRSRSRSSTRNRRPADQGGHPAQAHLDGGGNIRCGLSADAAPEALQDTQAATLQLRRSVETLERRPGADDSVSEHADGPRGRCRTTP